MKEENKKNNKLKQINIRLTEEDFSFFKEKGKNYPSMSALITDSVKQFNTSGGANKIEALNSWAIEFSAFKVELSRIGNNINQVAHYANILQTQQIVPDETMNVFIEKISEYNNLLKKMTELQEKFTRKVIKI